MDSKAASKIKAPPIRVRLSQLDAPSSTDDTLANSTSDSMTSAVVWAARRAAPYCSARLPNKKEMLDLRR